MDAMQLLWLGILVKTIVGIGAVVGIGQWLYNVVEGEEA